MIATDIFAARWKRKHLIALFVAIAVLICHVYLSVGQSYTAAVYIKYLEESAADGITTDGSMLDPYEIVEPSVYCVRQILLFNKEYSVKKKFALVKDHFAQPHIRALMERAEELVRDGKMRKKIKLVNKNRFLFLYGCFWVRELMQRFRSFCRSGRRQEG